MRWTSENLGDVHDIAYRNINIYTDADNLKPIIIMRRGESDKLIRNIRLEDIYINGKKAESFDEFATNFKNIDADSVTI